MFDDRYSRRRRDLYDVLGRFRMPLIAMIMVNTFGVLGYMIIDGYPFLDAFYQTVITVSTVGFQETHPVSAKGQLFVIVLIVGGVATWSYALGVTVSVVVNDDLIGKIREALMEHRLQQFENHFIVAGFTDVSRQLARQFRRQEIPFVVIEDNPDRILNIGEEMAGDVLPLNPFLNDSYRRANVKDARGVIAAFAEDHDNITVVATAKILEEEIKRELVVITLASRNEAKAKLEKVGADVVILPHELTGQRIAALALHPPDSEQESFLDRVAFGEFLNLDIRDILIQAGCALDGVAIMDSGIRKAIGAHILGVRRRRGRRLHMMPNPEMVLHAGDHVLIMGTLAQLDQLKAFLTGDLVEEE